MTKPKRLGQLLGKASILTAADVIQARMLYALGKRTAKELAVYHGVGVETIRRMLRRDTWQDVQDGYIQTTEEQGEAAKKSFERLQAELAKADDRPRKIKNIMDDLEEKE